MSINWDALDERFPLSCVADYHLFLYLFFFFPFGFPSPPSASFGVHAFGNITPGFSLLSLSLSFFFFFDSHSTLAGNSTSNWTCLRDSLISKCSSRCIIAMKSQMLWMDDFWRKNKQKTPVLNTMNGENRPSRDEEKLRSKAWKKRRRETVQESGVGVWHSVSKVRTNRLEREREKVFLIPPHSSSNIYLMVYGEVGWVKSLTLSRISNTSLLLSFPPSEYL